jgi:hypothetical protein
VTLGQFCVAVLCVTESAILAWLWVTRVASRAEVRALEERVTHLENHLHDVADKLNPLSLWVTLQRAKEPRRE